jgi:transcriptional regulator with XRE-family HTH domain
LHVAQKFERLIDAHRRPDGSRWTGQQLDEATGGMVPRAYFVNLRKGRIESPGYEKMLAIARAMGFPPALWFEAAPGEGTQIVPEQDRDLAARVGHLFQTIRHPRTGEPYTDAEVARMRPGISRGRMSREAGPGALQTPRWDRSLLSRPSSACLPRILWTGARTRRSSTRRRSTPSPTRPPQPY